MAKDRVISQRGFTVVEILIVIVVIGILAAVTIAGYNGIQRRTTETSMKSDLKKASDAMALERSKAGKYSGVLPAEAQSSPGIVLTVKPPLPTYSSLTNVQRGVLFHSICAGLVSEGYGVGVNVAGQVEQYITGCHVYNWNSLHINGWHSRNFSVPSIGQTTIRDWYNNTSNVSNDPWRPDKRSVMVAFADLLSSRYMSMTGGSFTPITSFWDPWASPGNGVMREEPVADASTADTTFCITGSSIKYTDMSWRINETGQIVQNACP